MGRVRTMFRTSEEGPKAGIRPTSCDQPGSSSLFPLRRDKPRCRHRTASSCRPYPPFSLGSPGRLAALQKEYETSGEAPSKPNSAKMGHSERQVPQRTHLLSSRRSSFPSASALHRRRKDLAGIHDAQRIQGLDLEHHIKARPCSDGRIDCAQNLLHAPVTVP